MRVLQVVTHMNRGGLETMLMNYYRHMDREKVQFDFLVHRQERAAYDDEIEVLGGKIYRLPVLNPFSYSYKKSLRQFFENHPEYQVIHVHQDCMSSVILKEAIQCGIPVRIAHSHNSSQDKNWKYLIKLWYKRKISKYATHLFACSEAAGKWMFGGADFQVINNAIDAKKYVYNKDIRQKTRNEFGIDVDEIVIGHVGRFCYQKNHTFLVDIFTELCKKTPAKLMLVGDGELRKEIEEKIRSLELQKDVIFTGIRSDVADLMQAMDVFVFPSNYEGLGIVVVEAQAAGIQCFISNKVPLECKMTDLVLQISLECSAEIWAKSIIEMINTERLNTYEKIKNAGFDIQENVARLQEFYIKADAGEKICLY